MTQDFVANAGCCWYSRRAEKSLVWGGLLAGFVNDEDLKAQGLALTLPVSP